MTHSITSLIDEMDGKNIMLSQRYHKFFFSLLVFFKIWSSIMYSEPVVNFWAHLQEKNKNTDCSSGYGTFDELVEEKQVIDYAPYTVITDDNFLLKMFRIFPKNVDIKKYKPSKGVALLMHGL